ncbi:unnamed protein product [Moneuplotes crassus]|uniref:Uncharacterized protein n=1 Tax=Euplotes crassus TaxID=5936 RepID=A0AAD1UE56_EUPCR|nr:unnamed protein product [Moneuplotes crassus]
MNEKEANEKEKEIKIDLGIQKKEEQEGKDNEEEKNKIEGDNYPSSENQTEKAIGPNSRNNEVAISKKDNTDSENPESNSLNSKDLSSEGVSILLNRSNVANDTDSSKYQPPINHSDDPNKTSPAEDDSRPVATTHSNDSSSLGLSGTSKDQVASSTQEDLKNYPPIKIPNPDSPEEGESNEESWPDTSEDPSYENVYTEPPKETKKPSEMLQEPINEEAKENLRKYQDQLFRAYGKEENIKGLESVFNPNAEIIVSQNSVIPFIFRQAILRSNTDEQIAILSDADLDTILAFDEEFQNSEIFMNLSSKEKGYYSERIMKIINEKEKRALIYERFTFEGAHNNRSQVIDDTANDRSRTIDNTVSQLSHRANSTRSSISERRQRDRDQNECEQISTGLQNPPKDPKERN